MKREDIAELAAILAAEHGQAALQIAESRRDQHRREKNSAAYELWDAITNELASRMGEPASAAAGREH